MRLPKIALRGALSSNKTREVQLPNILKIDPTLVDLLENKLDGVSTQEGFNKWKKQFLNRLKQDLNNDHGGAVASNNDQQQQPQQQGQNQNGGSEAEEVAYSAWSYVSMSHENFRKRMDKFVLAVSKVNRHVSAGTLTHSTVSVKARNSLLEFVKQCQGIEEELKAIAPRYLSEEKKSGYNVYHLSHVFVQSNFTEYERLNKALNTIRGLRQQVINDVAEKHILAQIDEFERFLVRFHATTIADIGLEGVLWKSRMFNPVSATTSNSQQPAIPNLRREPKPGDRGGGGRSVGTRGSVNSKSTNRTTKSMVSGRSGYSGDVDASTVGRGRNSQQQQQQQEQVKLRKVRKKSPRRIQSQNGRVEASTGVRKKLPSRSKSIPSGSSDESIDLQSIDGSAADNSIDIPKSPRREKAPASFRRDKAPESPRKGENNNKLPHRKSREERSGGKRNLPVHQRSSGSEDSSRGGEADNSNVKRKDKNGRNNQHPKKKQNPVKRQNSLRRQNSLSSAVGDKEKENDLNIASGRSILDNAIKMSSLASKGGKSTSNLNDLSEARKLLDSINMSDVDNDETAGGRVGVGEGPSFATRSSNVSFAASLDSGEAANPGVIARPAGATPLGFSKKDGVTEVKGLVKFQPKKPKKLKKKSWVSMIAEDDDDDNKSVVSIASKNKAKRKSVQAAKGKHSSLKRPSNALRSKTEALKKTDKKIKGVGVTTKKNKQLPPLKLRQVPANSAPSAESPKNGVDAVKFPPPVPVPEEKYDAKEEVETHRNIKAATEFAERNDALKFKGVPVKKALIKPSAGEGETAGVKKKSRSVVVKSGRPEPPLSKRKNKSVETKLRPKPQKQGSKLDIQWPPQKTSTASDTDGEGSVSSSERSSSSGRRKKSSAGSEAKKDNNSRQKKTDQVVRKAPKKNSPKVKQKSYWPSLLGAPEQENDEENDDLSLTFDMNLLPHIQKIPDVPIVQLPEEDSVPSDGTATSQPPALQSNEDEDRIPNLSLLSADTVESGDMSNDVEVEMNTDGLYCKNASPLNTDGEKLDQTDENDPVATCANEQSLSTSNQDTPHVQAPALALAAAERVSPESNSEDGVRLQTPTEGEGGNQIESDIKSTTSPTQQPSHKSQLLSKPVDTNSLLSPLGSPKKRLSGRKLYPWDAAGKSMTTASPSPSKGQKPVTEKPDLHEQPPTDLDPSASPAQHHDRTGQDDGQPPAIQGKLEAEHAQKLPQLSPLAKGTLGTVDRNRVSQVGNSPFAMESSVSDFLEDTAKLRGVDPPEHSPGIISETAEVSGSPSSNKAPLLSKPLETETTADPSSPAAIPSTPGSDRLPLETRIASTSLTSTVGRFQQSVRSPKARKFEMLSYLWNNKKEEEDTKSPLPPPPKRKLNKEYSWRKHDPATSQRDPVVNQGLLKPMIPAESFSRDEDSLSHTASSTNTTANRQEVLVGVNTRTEESKAYDKTRDELKKLADSIQVPAPMQSQRGTETETSDYEQTSSLIGSIRSPAAEKKSYPWEKPSIHSQDTKAGFSTGKEEQSFFPFSSDAPRSYPWKKTEVTSKYQPSGSELEHQQKPPPVISSVSKKAYPWKKTDSEPSKPEPAIQVGIDLKKSHPWNLSAKENPPETKDAVKPTPDDGMPTWKQRMNSQYKEKETAAADSVSDNQSSLPPEKTIGAGKATSFENKQNEPPSTESNTMESLLWDKLVDSTSKDGPADRFPSSQESERPATSMLPLSSHDQNIEIFSDTQHSNKVLANESAPPEPSKKFKPVSSWSKPSLVDDDDELSHPLKKPKDKKVRSAVGVKKTAKARPGRMKPQHTDDSSVVKMKKSNKKKGEMTFTKKVDNKSRGRGNRTFVHKSSVPMAPGVNAWGRNPFEN